MRNNRIQNNRIVGFLSKKILPFRSFCKIQKETDDTKNDIARLLDFFSMELEKAENEVNFTTVGNLKKIRKDLIETLSFMSGFSVDAIEDTLSEDIPEG